MREDSVLGNYWFQKNRKIRELAKGHTDPNDETLRKIFINCSEADLVRIWQRSSALRHWLTENDIFAKAMTFWAHPETAQEVSHTVLHVANLLQNSPYFLKQITTSPLKFLTKGTQQEGSTRLEPTQAKSVLQELYQKLDKKHPFIASAERAYKTANRWRSLGDVIRHWWYRVTHKGNLHPMFRGRELVKDVFNPAVRTAPVTTQEPSKQNPQQGVGPAQTLSNQATGLTPNQPTAGPVPKKSVVRNLSTVFDSEVTPPTQQGKPQTPTTLATGFRNSENAESSSGTPGSATSVPGMSPAPENEASTGPNPPSAELRVKVLKNTRSPLVASTPGSQPEMSPFVGESAEQGTGNAQDEGDENVIQSAFERIEI